MTAPFYHLLEWVIETQPTTSSSPLDLTGIAAMITAVLGVIAFAAAYLKGQKNNAQVREVEEAASYVKGFDSLIKRLQEEIEDLRAEHDQERGEWVVEKENLMRTIENLKTELQRSITEGIEIRGQLAELKGQIKGYLSTEEWREFQKHLS